MKIGSLKEGTDYTVAPNSSYNNGFIITFIKPINSSQLISYTTKFDSTLKVTQYKNTAALDWTENAVKQKTITKYGTADPDTYTKENGNKTGTYNAETKEITWTIDVNYNLHTITNALVRDFYTGKQTFVKGSLTVSPLTLTGGNNGVSAGASVTVPDSDVDYTVKDNGNDGFELKLGLINSAYRITYRTSLEGHRVEAAYNNKATMYDENTPNDLLFDKSATVNPSHGGEYVNKTGKQGTGADSDFAYWTVNINNSQSQVEAGAKLTDTLSANQILVQDSFKLYETDQYGKLTRAGIVSDSNYTLDVVGNTFTLTFKNELKRAYILEYKSFINADQNETISNDAKFEGQSAGAVDQNENKAFKVYFSGAGGGATTPKGNLTIVKVDAADHNIKLDGATFGLYDKTGNTLIKTGVTDLDGKVVFDNIKYKEYMLKELAAPTGYLFDVDYKAGKVITFNATNSTIQVENTKGVWDFELTKVDATDPTKALEGAHFKLQIKSNSGTYEDVAIYSDMVTLFDGKISYDALVKGGNYQLIETAAPSGYQLDATPIHFAIDQNQTLTKKVTMKNTKNVGSVELLKTDIHDGKVLEGVEFDLQDENGKVLQTGLTTDQDGKLSVGKLNAGHYQFVEVTPLPDYELNATPLPFDIVNDGVTVNVDFKNKLTPGSVKLTKTETGLPGTGLPGAQFSILDENKVLVVDKDGKGLKDLTTDVNGELRIPDLRPGKYYFEETVAPSGYIIKTTLTEFEIIKNQETIVIVENDRLISGGGGGTTPGIPVDPTPSIPVDPTPSTPVEPTPSIPVKPTPGTPVDPTPSIPVKPTPSAPVIPKENVTTPIETPIKGKVEVPNESIPNISGEPKNGTVTVDPKGNWVYTPDKGYIGKDSFEIIITDEDGHEQEVQIDVDVKAMPKDETDGTKNAGTTTQGQTVETLPQTGERSHLPLQLTGLSFIILGAILLLFRKKRLQ